MGVGIEERLLLALAVNVDEKRAQVPQQGERRQLVVDVDFVAPARRHLAADDDLVGVAAFEVDACRFEQGFETMLEGKSGKVVLNWE